MNSLDAFQERLGVTFKNQALLEQALTHRSYINEHPESELHHNERLEFLGDAVLELASTVRLFHSYPDEPEGQLTAYRAALVNTQSLAGIADDLDINEHVRLSRGEKKDTGRARQYILANTVEAIIGAIYLDQGYDAAADFISRFFYPKLDTILKDRLWQDAKSHLQEKAQEHESATPVYEVVAQEGPDHDKTFTVGVYVAGVEIAQGTGASKQEAEQAAAQAALTHKGWAGA